MSTFQGDVHLAYTPDGDDQFFSFDFTQDFGLLDHPESLISASEPFPTASTDPASLFPSLGNTLEFPSSNFELRPDITTTSESQTTGGTTQTTSTFRSHSSAARSRSPTYVPRPRNAFMIFRSAFWAEEKISRTVERDHRHISRIIAHCWNQMPEAEKAVWRRKAEEEKVDHEKRHPQYRFMPGSRTQKPVKRNVKRNGSKDLLRCRQVAELLISGKQGHELETAVKQIDTIVSGTSNTKTRKHQDKGKQKAVVPALSTNVTEQVDSSASVELINEFTEAVENPAFRSPLLPPLDTQDTFLQYSPAVAVTNDPSPMFADSPYQHCETIQSLPQFDSIQYITSRSCSSSDTPFYIPPQQYTDSELYIADTNAITNLEVPEFAAYSPSFDTNNVHMQGVSLSTHNPSSLSFFSSFPGASQYDIIFGDTLVPPQYPSGCMPTANPTFNQPHLEWDASSTM